MNKKKRKKYVQQYLVQRSRSRLMKQVVFLYFLTLLGLIFVTIKFGIPLEQGGGGVASPALWLSIIKTYYYVIPGVLAFVFGLFFRPFWRNFRNLLVTIFLIHLFFSLVIYATRYGYLQKQHVDIARSKIAELKILDLKKVFIDENKDGVLDQIKVTVSVDYNGFLEGHYALSALLTQGGQEFPQNRVQTGNIVYKIDRVHGLHFMARRTSYAMESDKPNGSKNSVCSRPQQRTI